MNKRKVESFEQYTNEGWFSKKPIEDRSDVGPDMKLKEINLKIKDAAYSLNVLLEMSKSSSFIKGAKWAIHNLTDEEIKYIRKNER